MTRLNGLKGLTWIELLVVACGCLFLLICAVPAFIALRQHAFRASCANNLARMGKAMLAYANDHNGALPRAGGPTSRWGGPVLWNASDRAKAFALLPDGSQGQATTSSSLYLLVKYAHVPTETFVCRADAGTTLFKLPDVSATPQAPTLADAWDFGPVAYRHSSYSYHIPYGSYALTTSRDPGLAVAADRNPWIDSPAGDAEDISRFEPDMAPYTGSPEQARKGNSPSHGGKGQNVLYLDGHVTFQKRAYCGLDDDNIYMTATSRDRGTPVGMVPSPSVGPMNGRDSVLVHDSQYLGPAMSRTTTTHHAQEVDSKTLKQTAVVATLDCPLPEHKNAIWCSTFQMAWDRLKTDVIGEPIEVLGAEELANRLNATAFPPGDIEAQSYYANAGFVKNGIIERIQKDMAQRFPSEPAPAFDIRYKTLPDVIMAYAYLNVDVGFQHPYYVNNDPFTFAASDGGKSKVTSFCSYARTSDGNNAAVREQAEILYYDYGDSAEAVQFAVDLGRNTYPYQVILARVPSCSTFGDATRTLREKAELFQKDPDYEVLHTLRPIDTMVVPDVLYKLTHHFEELLGKCLGNRAWTEHVIFDAMQKIDFTLSRTGVSLKSEARMGAAASRGRPPEQLAKPRHLRFDRPFLICVKKRQPGATPFFLMWVDNAELMQLVARDP
ncbi:MAG: hypothetical protein ABFD90_18695 [Phycisphaerales bacterium]